MMTGKRFKAATALGMMALATPAWTAERVRLQKTVLCTTPEAARDVAELLTQKESGASEEMAMDAVNKPARAQLCGFYLGIIAEKVSSERRIHNGVMYWQEHYIVPPGNAHPVAMDLYKADRLGPLLPSDLHEVRQEI